MGEVVPNQLFVAGYSRNKIPDEKGIKDIFKKYGTIKDVAYKGAYSFVTFSSESEAQNAISALNGQQINGQKLKVDIVDNRKGRRNGPQDNDECFKCGKGGHWYYFLTHHRARECPNRQSPTRRTKYSDSRSRHRRSKRSNSRSHSYSSYSSSHSRRRRDAKKRSRYNRRSRSPRRDNKRKKSSSCKRSQSNSRSRSSVSNKQRQSHKSSSSK